MYVWAHMSMYHVCEGVMVYVFMGSYGFVHMCVGVVYVCTSSYGFVCACVEVWYVDVEAHVGMCTCVCGLHMYA